MREHGASIASFVFGFFEWSVRLLVSLGLFGQLISCSSDEESRLKVAQSGKASANQILTLSGSTSSLSFINLAPSQVCSDITFLNAQGETQVGTRLCGTGSVPSCASDGQENCQTTAAFKAASSSVLVPANIKIGKTLGGVNGSVGVLECNADNQTNCVATTSFKAFNASLFLPANYVNTITLGGSVGTLSPPPSACASNGSQGCLVQGSYFSGVTCGELGSGCYLPLYASGSQNQKAINVTNINSNASKIKSGVTVAGVLGTLPDCAGAVRSDCFAPASFVAVDSTLLNVGNIRASVVIGGVTGEYPSETYPLAGASATADLDGATFSAKIKADTSFEYWDSAGARHLGAGSSLITPANILKDIDVFGAVGTMMSLPPPEHVRFGVNPGPGTLKTSCRNLANIAAYDIDLSLPATQMTADAGSDSFSSALPHGLVQNDQVILLGDSVPGGLTFGVKYYVKYLLATSVQLSSTAGGTTLDFTSGGTNLRVVRVSPNSSADSWDSLDDSLSVISFSHLGNHEICGGIPNTTHSVFADVTKDSGGNATTCSAYQSNCTLLDKSSGLWWSKMSPSPVNWTVAGTYCTSLNHNTYTSGWRLPTQKELHSLYIHGIHSGSNSNHISNTSLPFWSATTFSQSTGYAHTVILSNGLNDVQPKTSSNMVTCVREAL